MNKKVELVLNELIKLYLKNRKPISSTLLKELTNINLAPSTIRGYFQLLEKNGLIEKKHFSSGSFPSKKAMEIFWSSNFPKNFEFNLDILEKISKEFEVVFIAKVFENQMLVDVYNLNNRFIVLEFENNEVVIRYSDEMYRFLKSLKNLYLKNLEKFIFKYKLDLLEKKLKIFQKELNFNEKLLYNKFNKLNSTFLNEVDDIKFIDNILIKKFKFNSHYKEFEISLIGDIYTDFLSLFDFMKGGDFER